MLAGALALAVVALAGCSSISAGRVTDKGYDPAYSITTITTIGGCTCYPNTQDYPECWRLDIADHGETGWICVPEQVWNETAQGEWVSA